MALAPLPFCASGSRKVRERPELSACVVSGALGRGAAGAERGQLGGAGRPNSGRHNGVCFCGAAWSGLSSGAGLETLLHRLWTRPPVSFPGGFRCLGAPGASVTLDASRASRHAKAK